jgi:hypothetical protein
LASIERWLSEEERWKAVNETDSPPQFSPEIDFNRFAKFSPNNRLPDREELKAYLKSKSIEQDEAIDSLVRVFLEKIAAKNNSKPLVVFLSVPTGTDKTALSKALAEAPDSELVRFDMGSFPNLSSTLSIVSKSLFNMATTSVRRDKKRN